MVNTKKKNFIKDTIVLIILLIILYFAYQFYQTNNFNDFVRKESNLYTAEFKRDDTIKYSNQRSYKIKTESFNDVMFSKEIKVNKNTPYKVSCMVKTNNIQAEESKTGIGAQISITDTTERSVAIRGRRYGKCSSTWIWNSWIWCGGGYPHKPGGYQSAGG